MKQTFKKILLAVLMIVAVMAGTSVIAATGKVAGGKHDFSASGTSFQYKAGVGVMGDQVCVYCHTPHNAGKTKLLWNKAGNGNTNFRLYTSNNGTLSNATRTGSALTANSPSLFCLSCHDGKTAVNVLHTGGKGVTAAAAGLTGYPTGSMLAFGNTPIVLQNMYVFGFEQPGPNLGGTNGDDLTNDHPIGFSYTAAQTEKTAVNLKAIGSVDGRVKFFGATSKVECTTCHDPHIDNVALPNQNPFLVMENDSSKLCLTCHNK